MLPKAHSVLWLLFVFISGCEAPRIAKERDLYMRVDAIADRYHAARTTVEKAETQKDILAAVDRAERDKILKNGGRYYVTARVFAHLRLAKIAFDDGDAAAADFHRGKAAELNRDFSMEVLGGIDLASAAILPEIARQVQRLDSETK